MSTELEKQLETIDRKLSALLAVMVHRMLLDDPSLATPRPRNVDQMLSDAGLKQAEIADLLGKTTQAVSQAVAKTRK